MYICIYNKYSHIYSIYMIMCVRYFLSLSLQGHQHRQQSPASLLSVSLHRHLREFIYLSMYLCNSVQKIITCNPTWTYAKLRQSQNITKSSWNKPAALHQRPAFVLADASSDDLTAWKWVFQWIKLLGNHGEPWGTIFSSIYHIYHIYMYISYIIYKL